MPAIRKTFLSLALRGYEVREGVGPVVTADIVQCTIVATRDDKTLHTAPITLTGKPTELVVPPWIWSREVQGGYDLSPRRAVEMLLTLFNSNWEAIPPAPRESDAARRRLPPSMRARFDEAVQATREDALPQPPGYTDDTVNEPVDIGSTQKADPFHYFNERA